MAVYELLSRKLCVRYFSSYNCFYSLTYICYFWSSIIMFRKKSFKILFVFVIVPAAFVVGIGFFGLAACLLIICCGVVCLYRCSTRYCLRRFLGRPTLVGKASSFTHEVSFVFFFINPPSS